jgi:hypothetical protein
MQVRDYTGVVMHDLTATHRVGSNARGKALWFCQCKCGGHTIIPSDALAAGKQKSCGCRKYEGFDAEHKRRTKYVGLAGLLANCTRVGGCLEWNGYCNPKTKYAHSGGVLYRRVYALVHGLPLPSVVMHTCDNPKCINPDHLRAGTPKANSIDMAAKGRAGKQKVHPSQYPTIIARLAAGELQRDVGIEYGISQSAISSIKRKYTA